MGGCSATGGLISSPLSNHVAGQRACGQHTLSGAMGAAGGLCPVPSSGSLIPVPGFSFLVPCIQRCPGLSGSSPLAEGAGLEPPAPLLQIAHMDNLHYKTRIPQSPDSL